MSRDHGFHPLRVGASCRRPTTRSRSCSTCRAESPTPSATRPGSSARSGSRSATTSSLRCYSMSSSPTRHRAHHDGEARGRRTVSNWLLDEVTKGDVLVSPFPRACSRSATRRPAPRVHRRERHHAGDLGDQERARHHRPIGAAALREPQRQSVIFAAELDALRRDAPRPVGGRAPPRHRAGIRPLRRGDAEFVGDRPRRRLLRVRPRTVHGRRGGRAGHAPRAVGPRVHRALRLRGGRSRHRRDAAPARTATATETVVIVLDGKSHEVHYQAGETFLETAAGPGCGRRSRARPGAARRAWPTLERGKATMRVNNALTPEEVAEGWVLTCQGFPRRRPSRWCTSREVARAVVDPPVA